MTEINKSSAIARNAIENLITDKEEAYKALDRAVKQKNQLAEEVAALKDTNSRLLMANKVLHTDTVVQHNSINDLRKERVELIAERDKYKAEGEYQREKLMKHENAIKELRAEKDGTVSAKRLAEINDLRDELRKLTEENESLKAITKSHHEIINSPQSNDFLRAVSCEAEHQRHKWKGEDASKGDLDWYWLIGYLAGKATHAAAAGDIGKAEHHIITTAAACANWHRKLMGKSDESEAT